MSMAEDVTVADAIKQLRAQLDEAQREGAGKDLGFLTKSIELELGIVFRSEKEGSGGVKAWVLDISGKAKTGNEMTHKVKLVLEPVGPEGGPLKVRSTQETQP
jgi:hypothetical protein